MTRSCLDVNAFSGTGCTPLVADTPDESVLRRYVTLAEFSRKVCRLRIHAFTSLLLSARCGMMPVWYARAQGVSSRRRGYTRKVGTWQKPRNTAAALRDGGRVFPTRKHPLLSHSKRCWCAVSRSRCIYRYPVPIGTRLSAGWMAYLMTRIPRGETGLPIYLQQYETKLLRKI